MCDYLESIKVLSPVGVWEVQFCKSGLHWVKLEKGQSQNIDLNVKVEVTGGRDFNYPLVKWLSVYFESIWSLKSISLPVVCPVVFRGGGFREKVWQKIYQELGVGETATYGEIAARCGSHGASQAVGTAMRTNPVRRVLKFGHRLS